MRKFRKGKRWLSLVLMLAIVVSIVDLQAIAVVDALDSATSLFEQLLAAESTEAMYATVLDIMQSDPDALNALTADEVDALRTRIGALDPEGDDADTQDLLDTLNNLLENNDTQSLSSGNDIDAAVIFYANTTTASYFRSGNNSSFQYSDSSDSIIFTATADADPQKDSDPYHYFTIPSTSALASNTYETYKYIAVTYRATAGSSLELFLTSTGHEGAVRGDSLQQSYDGADEYKTIIFTISDDLASKMGGTITGFRLDYRSDPGTFELDSIAFCKTEEDAKYIAWERDAVRNHEGEFVANEQMIHMFFGLHNCTVEYVKLQEGDQSIGVFKITMIKTNCSCHADKDNEWHTKGTEDAFDPQFKLKIPGSISANYDYMVLNFMAPSLDVVGECGGDAATHPDGDDHDDRPVDAIPIRIGTFYAVNGGYTSKFERNTTINAPGVFYSEIVNIDDDLQNDAAEIRIDPFNTHFAEAGSVLYLQAVMFCETKDEAVEVGQEQLGKIYPYGYSLNFEPNADGVTDMPESQAIMQSAYSTHVFTVAPITPERENYTFKGWSLSKDGSGEIYQPNEIYTIEGEYGTTVSRTLYAIWQEGTNYITYISDIAGATLSNGESFTYQQQYGYDSEFNLLSATAEGYTFDGWILYLGSGNNWTEQYIKYEGNEITMPKGTTGAVTLKANFIPNKYTIAFDSRDGSAIDTITLDFGTVLEQLPISVRYGYNFLGWEMVTEEGNVRVTDEQGVITYEALKSMPAHNIEMYALWERALTSLTISVNGIDTALDPDQVVLFGVTGNGVNLTVAVRGNGSVTIDGLTIGQTYTISIDNDWSWRYESGQDQIEAEEDADGVKTANSITLTLQEKQKITFTMTRDNSLWLDGNSPNP